METDEVKIEIPEKEVKPMERLDLNQNSKVIFYIYVFTWCPTVSHTFSVLHVLCLSS